MPRRGSCEHPGNMVHDVPYCQGGRGQSGRVMSCTILPGWEGPIGEGHVMYHIARVGGANRGGSCHVPYCQGGRGQSGRVMSCTILPGWEGPIGEGHVPYCQGGRGNQIPRG